MYKRQSYIETVSDLLYACNKSSGYSYVRQRANEAAFLCGEHCDDVILYTQKGSGAALPAELAPNIYEHCAAWLNESDLDLIPYSQILKLPQVMRAEKISAIVNAGEPVYVELLDGSRGPFRCEIPDLIVEAEIHKGMIYRYLDDNNVQYGSKHKRGTVRVVPEEEAPSQVDYAIELLIENTSVAKRACFYSNESVLSMIDQVEKKRLLENNPYKSEVPLRARR